MAEVIFFTSGTRVVYRVIKPSITVLSVDIFIADSI
jgi:hypothetical protein